LRRIEKNDLYIKPEKCVWKVREIDFLGLVMESRGIKMQEEKIAGVLEWPRPKTVKAVQKFLGLAKWLWGEKQEKAFEQLKKVFMMQLVLVAPDLDKEMRVEADASEYATGVVLLMKYEDEKWRPVAFISKSLNKAERNYEIHNREMLAIIRCLDEWKQLLEGAQNKFEIWSDHKNLEYFMSS